MPKQQEPNTQPVYGNPPVLIPGEGESSSTYWERVAREKSAANAAKAASIPSLNAVFAEKRVAEQLQAAQAKAEQAAQPAPSWVATMLPKSDPLVVESRRKRVQGE